MVGSRFWIHDLLWIGIRQNHDGKDFFVEHSQHTVDRMFVCSYLVPYPAFISVNQKSYPVTSWIGRKKTEYLEHPYIHVRFR